MIRLSQYGESQIWQFDKFQIEIGPDEMRLFTFDMVAQTYNLEKVLSKDLTVIELMKILRSY